LKVATAADLIAQADSAAADGDLKRAEGLLDEAAQIQANDAGLFLKLAAIQRGTGQPDRALESVHRALAIDPRDFTALLMRASLLDRLNDPEAPEAWAHAIAQKPDGELPPGLMQVIAQGEQRVAAWQDERDDHLKAAMRAAEQAADDELRHRLRRFRDNILRRTRVYHSEPTHFHYPGLVEREFPPRRLFPWIEALEAATDEIAAEFQSVMTAERAELVPYIQYPEHQPLDQWRALNQSRDWTAIHLLQNGERVDANVRHCPRTLEILATCDQPQVRGASPNAMFSLLAPNTAIPPHVGVNNARLVCHLPLIVPEGCWFRVGGETRYWRRGEALLFDDTMEHEAINPSDELRVVLIFDVWRPELEPLERQAIAAAIEAETPGVGAGL
jgi:aspartyl/asparaginyl beta-hydroxylase (cupin superfamily)